MCAQTPSDCFAAGTVSQPSQAHRHSTASCSATEQTFKKQSIFISGAHTCGYEYGKE